jgi:hypothetical protein
MAQRGFAGGGEGIGMVESYRDYYVGYSMQSAIEYSIKSSEVADMAD